MDLNFEEMKEAKRKQDAAIRAQEAASEAYNNAVDEFDALVKECEFYIPCVVHGENDPDCDHPDIETKWCEALECPLLK